MNTACVNKLSKHIPNSYIYYPFSQRINLIKQTIIIIMTYGPMISESVQWCSIRLAYTDEWLAILSMLRSSSISYKPVPAPKLGTDRYDTI